MLKAKGWVVGLAVVVSAFAAVAMPTKAEFQKVLPIVKEISADDIAAVKAGKMKPVVAGDNALERAKDMSLDEASRYLFFESAFAHYVRAEEYDKAAGVIDALKSTIEDVPDSSVIELIERRLRKIPRKHAGQLYAMLQDARSRERVNKRLAVYKKAAAANPSDPIPQGRLAASYVLLGDWESAAKAFGKSGGEVAKVVAAETSGGMAADKIADFWWTYKLLDTEFTDSADDLEEAFKAHAAVWYRKALQNGEIAGVKRQLIEKRIKGQAPDKAADAVAAATVAKKEPAPAPAVKMATSGGLQTMSIEIARGRKMEFVQCPAGTFVTAAGNKNKWNNPTDSNYRREVTISRPFWVSKYPVTVGDYEAVMGEKLPLTPAQKAVGPKMKLPVIGYELSKNGFLRRLANAAARQLPKGVVLRLPTEAEIVAIQTDYGVTNKGHYCQPQYCYVWKDIKQLLSAKGVPIPEPGNPSKRASDDSLSGPGGVLGPVGEREPSALGLYDLSTDSYPVIDLVSTLANNGDGPRSPRKPKETDPLYVDGPNLMCVHGKYWYSGTFWHGTLRLVIGPDLIKEKGLEAKYKHLFQ